MTDALGRTWQGAALHPRSFFGSIPANAALGPPIVYYMLIGVAAEGAQLFWAMVLHSTVGTTSNVTSLLGAAGAMAPVIDFLLSPLLLLFSLFMAAGVTHLLLLVLGAATHGYAFTVVVFAFAYSPQLLEVIPFVGQVAGFVWMVGVAIIGLAAGHGVSTPRAAAAVIIPVAIALLFIALAAMVGAAGGLLTGAGGFF
ncbi:MAG: YIP1 family protein [Gemmatimonadota bacterium]